MLDCIVVGQGIAGSLLAWQLLLKGASVLVIDDEMPFTASKVSTGLLNPSSGKKMRPVANIETLLPQAISTYRDLELQFQTTFLRELPIFRIFNSAEQQNDWCADMQEVTFSKNFSNREVMFLNEQQFVNPYGACCVKGGAQVLAKKLLQALRLHFAQSNSLLSETFDHQQLRCSQNHIGYKMYHARHLVFCEGWRAASNPFFPEIKFQPAKGELLRIRCSALPPDQIVMGAAVLTPADAESEFDVGAVYEWQAATQEPSPKNHELLLQLLAKTIRVPFEVVAHTAATRPTVYDRQPLAMFHHQYSTLSVINGLGTKGFMWAPFFAEWMSTEILMRLGNSFDN